MKDGEVFTVEYGPFRVMLIYQEGEAATGTTGGLFFDHMEVRSQHIVGWPTYSVEDFEPSFVRAIEEHAEGELDELRASHRRSLEKRA